MAKSADYQRRKEFHNKCARCSGYRDDRNFATCSKCRKIRTVGKKKDKALRDQAMSLFGIKREE